MDDPNLNNLIIGMGPVGLYLAIRLLNEGKKVTIVENRHEFTRKQILGLIPENYEKIKEYCKNKYTFGKIRLPRTDFDGYICDDLKLEDNKKDVNVYSFTLNVLQTELFNYIQDKPECEIIKPNSEYDSLEITFDEINNKIDFIFKTVDPRDKSLSLEEDTRSKIFNFSNFNNIFFCSGGGEKINLVSEIRNMYKHYVPDLTKKEVIINEIKNMKVEESNIPVVGKGYIVYLLPRDADDIKYLIEKKKSCNFSEFELYQNKFRLFISPSILEYGINNNNVVNKNNKDIIKKDIIDKENIFIYLGIQLSNNEESILNKVYNNDKYGYIEEYIKVVSKYYDIDLSRFTKKYGQTGDENKLPEFEFNIQLSYFTNCIKKSEKGPRICLVGDALSKVNFFSYSGFNYGMINVDAIMSSILGEKYLSLGEKENNPINNDNIFKYMEKSKYSKDKFLRSSLTVTIREFGLTDSSLGDNEKIKEIVNNIKKLNKKEYNRIINILEDEYISLIIRHSFALSLKIPNIEPVYKGIFKFKKIKNNEYVCAWSKNNDDNYILGKWTGNWDYSKPKEFKGVFTSLNGYQIIGHWYGQWDKDLKGDYEFIGIFNKESENNRLIIDEDTKKILEDFKKKKEFIGGSYINKIDILELYYKQKYLIYKNKYLDLKKQILNK